MRLFIAPCLLLLLLAGCTGQAEKTMGGGEALLYPEFEAFEQELLGVNYPAAKKQWGEVKKFAASKAFGEAVSKFESAPVPSAYSDRQAAKDNVIAAAKELQSKATAGNDEVEAAYKKLTEATKALRG